MSPVWVGMCVWLLLAQFTQATSIRDGWYDTTITDTTNTDTSSWSINTWFLATLIRYLAHVMYFGVPGTCGTSVPSERLFSKATARSNIKPKNVDMILFLNNKLVPFWHCAVIYGIFWFVWGREAVSYGMVSVYHVNTIELPLPGWYYPMTTSNCSKIYMPADIDRARSSKNFKDIGFYTTNSCPMPNAQCQFELLIYPGHDAGTCGFCGVCCGYSLTVAELWIALWTLLYACVDLADSGRKCWCGKVSAVSNPWAAMKKQTIIMSPLQCIGHFWPEWQHQWIDYSWFMPVPMLLKSLNSIPTLTPSSNSGVKHSHCSKGKGTAKIIFATYSSCLVKELS